MSHVTYWIAPLALSCCLALPAQAELYVVMGVSSKPVQLNLQNIKNIFLGRINTLPGGARAIPIDQHDGNPLREEFYVKVTNLSAAQAKAHWARLYFTGRGTPPVEARNSQDIKLQLNQIPNTLSYLEKAALDSTVRIIQTIP